MVTRERECLDFALSVEGALSVLPEGVPGVSGTELLGSILRTLVVTY